MRKKFPPGMQPIIERRDPWWNAISSSIRGVVPVPMNPAIKGADVVSALFTTRVLGNFPDAYFPRKWKGHSTDLSPVSSLNIGSKEPRECQGKKASLLLLFPHLHRDDQGLATYLLLPNMVWSIISGSLRKNDMP